jgi:hypothetical protein
VLDETGESGTAILTPVLWHGGRSLDRLRCGINMKVKFTWYQFRETSKLKMPALAYASVTYFLILVESAVMTGMNRNEFLKDVMENHMDLVSLVKSNDVSSVLMDYPHAMMYENTWKSHCHSMRVRVQGNASLEEISSMMLRYQTIQMTILDKGLLMDLFMSDRVLETVSFGLLMLRLACCCCCCVWLAADPLCRRRSCTG